MKLLELHINHFGTFSDQRFSFTDGLNVFCHENGFGKSTLLGYIKAMFYGFNETRSPSLEENDRKKYLPWNGGTCGGSLTFELEGVRYRIERIFGKKPGDDTLTVYNETRGILTTQFGENPGQSIFKIDAEGFLRTLALSERMFKEEENKSVSGRLSEVVGTGGAMDGLKEALDLLTKQQRDLTKISKKGVLDTLKQEVSALEAELREITQETQRLPQLNEDIEVAQRRLEEAKHEIEVLEKELLEDTSVSEEMLRQSKLAQLEKSHTELLRKFYTGVPTVEEIDEVQRCDGLYSDAEIAEYVALRNRFEGRTSQKQVEEKQSEVRTLVASASAEDGSEFLGKHPSLAKVEGLEEQIREYPKVLQQGKFKMLALVLLALGVISLVSGIFVLPILFVGVALLIGAVLIYVLRPKANISSSALSLIREVMESEGVTASDELLALLGERQGALALAEKAKERERIRTNLLSFLSGFGYVGENPEECFARLYNDFSRYNAFCIREFDKAERTVARVRAFRSKYSHFGTPPYAQLRSDLYQLGTIEKQMGEMQMTPASDAVAQRKNKEARLSELRVSIQQMQNIINALYLQRDKIEEKNDRRQEILSQIEEKNLEKIRYEARLRVLTLAEAKLRMAKEEMQSSYLRPTRESFDALLKGLSGLSSGEVSLGSDFKLSFQSRGLSHGMDAMSRGERDLYLLIARLAIVDTLYPEGMLPPMFLDDPFVAFDDERTKVALSYLRALGEKRQILYFTCSGARTE